LGILGKGYVDLLHRLKSWDAKTCATRRPPQDLYDYCVAEILYHGLDMLVSLEEAGRMDLCKWLRENPEKANELRRKGLYPTWC